MLGSKPVLEALLDVVMKQAANGSPDVALDVVTAVICAPVAGERYSLRHALHSAYSDVYTLSKRDATRAEIVVRLQRRVEAQGTRSSGSGMDGVMGGAMEGGVDVSGDGGAMLLDMGAGNGGGEADQEGMEGMLDVELGMQMGTMMDAGAEDEDYLGL